MTSIADDDLSELEMWADAKYREIIEMVAANLGITLEWTTSGDPTPSEKRAERRVRLILNLWEEIEQAPTPQAPATPLETLMHEHYETGKRITALRNKRPGIRGQGERE
jgi:hypothetical protein